MTEEKRPGDQRAYPEDGRKQGDSFAREVSEAESLADSVLKKFRKRAEKQLKKRKGR